MSNPAPIAALLPEAVEALRKDLAPDCERCKVQMIPRRVVAIPQYREVDCWHCPVCGRLISKP